MKTIVNNPQLIADSGLYCGVGRKYLMEKCANHQSLVQKCKKLFVLICCLAISFGAWATGQDGDIIIINSERWILLGKPIEAHSAIYNDLLKVLPQGRTTTTANWDGYTAYWSIKRERLCLDSIAVEFYNKERQRHNERSLPSAELRRVFKDFFERQNIVATWFTGKLRVAKGDVIYYQHDGYERNYEFEQTMAVKNGKITERKSYRNRIAVNGFSLSDCQTPEDFKAKLQLRINDYPELIGVNRIIFTIKDIHVDSKGNLIDCQVTATVRRQGKSGSQKSERLAKDVKSMLKNIRPWKTLFINGEYVSPDRPGYNIPYLLDK